MYKYTQLGYIINQGKDKVTQWKRGGIRVIYYWWKTESEFYLFTLYDKDQASDLTKEQRQTLKKALGRIKGE